MFVYFIQAVEGGPVKIGRSAKVEQRLRTVQRYNPAPLAVKAMARGWGGAERRVHRFFDLDRLTDDWFEPSPELLAFMAKLPSLADAQAGAYVPLISANTDAYKLLKKRGFTMQEIGDHYGMTKQAISLHTQSVNHWPDKDSPRPEITVAQFIEENPDLFDDSIELS